MEPQVGAAASAIAVADFSFWTLFTRADFIVKSVIIILILASIYSWALIFEKYKVFKKIFKSTEEFEQDFLNSKSIRFLDVNFIYEFICAFLHSYVHLYVDLYRNL